ncbi:MAG: putative ribonuclease match [Frankiales bacterium]|nr:putative ribonuclease match [Frankiales bacterium]
MVADENAAEITDGTAPEEEVSPPPVLLRTPRDGTPTPLTRPEELAEAARGLAAGTGPVAVDAERASGYRYSQRAYLVQLRRLGYRTVLIDPIALPDLSAIDDALADAEWILHAANQDLPCLADLGMRPRALFDSELAGRLLGSDRVALGTMVEQYLGVRLEKGHSAADWSTRPLPSDWLDYAALDVELLIELREVLVEELRRAGKLEWAAQEFLAVMNAPPAPPRVDPWRRTSGIHGIRNRRTLAMIRGLWQARDRLASERDVAPGRILPDSAIMSAVKAGPSSPAELSALPVFNGPRQRRQADYWFRALETARQLEDPELPLVSPPTFDPDSMPAPSRWRERDPQAAVRLAAIKQVVAEAAPRLAVVSQNLLAGDVIRRLAWRATSVLDEAQVRTELAKLGARAWQVDTLAADLTAALEQAAATSAAALAEAESVDGAETTGPSVSAASSAAGVDASDEPRS